MILGPLPTNVLLRPKHIHSRVSSPIEYRLRQLEAIRSKMDAFPNLHWNLPWDFEGTVPVKVSDSCWQLVCPCGNTPAYDPEWELACCFSCGAIFNQPPPIDWNEIEHILIQRPLLQTRHFLPGETLSDLIQENREHGDPAEEF